jgi:hypothetical protein
MMMMNYGVNDNSIYEFINKHGKVDRIPMVTE